MPIPNLTDETPINQYTANSGETEFAFTFYIFALSDIKVYANDVLKTITTDYVVRKNDGNVIGDADLPMDGGKIIFNVGRTAGEKISLNRDIPVDRSTQFSTGGAFKADSLNSELTRILTIAQQLKRDIARSFRLAPSDAEGGSLQLPTDRADNILAFDSNSNLILTKFADFDKANVSPFMATLLDDVSASIARETLNAQELNANLTALANLNGSANKIPYFNGVGSMALADLQSNRNAIINGDFNVWQRGTSFTSVAHATYTADRWLYLKSGSMVHDITWSSDVPTVAQAGRLFSNSLKIDCQTVDSSIAASDYAAIRQRIEGHNFIPLAQKEITVSFWVKATKIGVYSIHLINGGNDRSCIKEINVNASNTWEYKTLTFPASPATGTWNYAGGIGLQLGFTLASGTTFQTTKDTWQTGSFFATANQVNACDSTSNDFLIAGVQLEAGSVATPFEYRTIQQELSLCQRYFEILPSGVIGAFNSNTSYAYWAYKVQKRITPTFFASASSKFSSVNTNCETHVIVQISNNDSYINGGSSVSAEL
ncbi:hypothetical protein UFOVP831_21 [uncultured Caudovirales phage]|uniref:Uncharacterized protein n=1 Tax=uncultured Caudovirales phage TaxID=2100421 RepID=A0A6J5NZN1_9CAUD|nr:hypothetical protein UFOVP831_21 [uncultured Caudovirales phage]